MNLGSFLQTIRVSLVRFTPEGLIDSTFTGPLNRYPVSLPLSVAPNEQGSVFAGSTITSRIENTSNWIAITLVQTNGVPDSSFQVRNAPMLRSVFKSETRQLEIQSDGKILFCSAIYEGTVRTAQSQYLPTRAVIGRLLPDGTWDNSFGLVSCDLSEANQIPGPFWFNNLSRLLAVPYQPVPAVTFAQQPDGIIVIGGTFNSINGEPRHRLARLEPNGTLRGRLQMGFTATPPRELIFPEEIEKPYLVETSTDLVRWVPWVQNDHPWWSLQLPILTDAPARYFRARFVPQQEP